MRTFVGIGAILALLLVGYALYANGTSSSDDHDSDIGIIESTSGSISPAPTMPIEATNGAITDDVSDQGGPDSSDQRCFEAASADDSALAGKTIIVDPGHGGEDLGTVNNQFGLHESDLVLSISEYLRDMLTASGANVCMTRVQDTYIELAARADFANEQNGDALVSIHLNSLPDPSESYTMTMWGNEAKDRFLAETMLDVLRYEMAIPQYHNNEPNPTNPDVYILESLDSHMLKSADMPAVLVEATFLSAAWEAQAFQDGIDDGSHWREVQIAEAVHTGLTEYYEAFQ